MESLRDDALCRRNVWQISLWCSWNIGLRMDRGSVKFETTQVRKEKLWLVIEQTDTCEIFFDNYFSVYYLSSFYCILYTYDLIFFSNKQLLLWNFWKFNSIKSLRLLGGSENIKKIFSSSWVNFIFKICRWTERIARDLYPIPPWTRKVFRKSEFSSNRS